MTSPLRHTDVIDAVEYDITDAVGATAQCYQAVSGPKGARIAIAVFITGTS